MDSSPLTALSPLDGRYAAKCDDFREYFSEFGLIRLRTLTEVRWIQFLADCGPISTDSTAVAGRKSGISTNWPKTSPRITPGGSRRSRRRRITTSRQIEYLIAEQLGDDADLARIRPFVHFACTSEDINNIAYALMLREGRSQVVRPALRRVIEKFRALPRPRRPICRCCHGPTARARARRPSARNWPMSSPASNVRIAGFNGDRDHSAKSTALSAISMRMSSRIRMPTGRR